MTEAARLRIDGCRADAVPADDRAFGYGDGLFETVLLDRGRPVWWEAHLARLERGAGALGIAAPTRDRWQADLAGLFDDDPEAARGRSVLRLVLSAGSGARGYGREAQSKPRRILQWRPAPAPLPRDPGGGIAVRWCELQLAWQPRLAGLKHLNRLEQVLARAEWDDPAIAEGLLSDAGGAVVSAIAANLFVVRAGRLLTPPVDRCGVAGTCRAFLLDRAEVRRLRREDVLTADEVFVCNSLRGILPVTRLGDRAWTVGPLTGALAARLAAAEPAFAAGNCR